MRTTSHRPDLDVIAAQSTLRLQPPIVTREEEHRAIKLMRSYIEPVLRRRDGDVCQLCDEPIDFTLREHDIDHRIPLRVLWHNKRTGPACNTFHYQLVHRACHRRKTAEERRGMPSRAVD